MAMRIREAVPADAASMARVHVDSWRETYPGIVPAEYLASLSYQKRESVWTDILSAERPAECNFVAETDDGEMVGFAGGGPEREGSRTFRGELYAIYVLEEHQRAGLGRRLVSAVVRRLLSDGLNSMLVWVLEGNRPACRFYEALGGTIVDRTTVTMGGAELPELAYGWNDIARLAADKAGAAHDGR